MSFELAALIFGSDDQIVTSCICFVVCVVCAIVVIVAAAEEVAHWLRAGVRRDKEQPCCIRGADE